MAPVLVYYEQSLCLRCTQGEVQRFRGGFELAGQRHHRAGGLLHILLHSLTWDDRHICPFDCHPFFPKGLDRTIGHFDSFMWRHQPWLLHSLSSLALLGTAHSTQASARASGRACPLVSTGILAETIEILPVQGSKPSKKTSKTTNKSFGWESFGARSLPISTAKKEKKKQKTEIETGMWRQMS